MISLLGEHEYRARLILEELSKGPKPRSALIMRAVNKGISPGIFQTTFKRLADCGRVRKESSAKRSRWVITERGQKLLEALS